jgi:hypothetical protein
MIAQVDGEGIGTSDSRKIRPIMYWVDLKNSSGRDLLHKPLRRFFRESLVPIPQSLPLVLSGLPVP